MIFVGDDWAEAHHDVYVCDEAGAKLASKRLPEGVEGMAKLHDLVASAERVPTRVNVSSNLDGQTAAPWFSRVGDHQIHCGTDSSGQAVERSISTPRNPRPRTALGTAVRPR